MKKFLLKFSLVAILTATLASCEADKVMYRPNGSNSLAAFVSGNGGLAITDDNNTTEILVSVANATNADRVIVLSIDPESTALADDYEIVSSSLVIPANSYEGKIIVTGNADAFSSGEKRELILKLESVGDAYVSKKPFVLGIFRSCPLDLDSIGTNFSGTTYIEGDYVTEFVPVMTQSPTNKNVFTLNTLWGSNFVADATGNAGYANQYLYPGTITINSDYSLTINTTAGYGSTSSGTYDPCENTFSYNLNQGLFTGTWTADVELLPNN